MPETRLGKLLLKNKLVTAGQIQDALVKQLSTPEVPLGQILCRMGALRSEDLELILDQSDKRRKLEDILLKKNWIDEAGLKEALDFSRKTQIPLQKALLTLKRVNEDDLMRAVAIRYDLPYMDLEGFQPDPALARLVNANFAKRHKIVPVALDGHNVTLAMASPMPRSEMRQIENFIKCRIKPVISSESDIAAVMQRLYGLEKPADSVPPAGHSDVDGAIRQEAPPYKSAADAGGGDMEPMVKKLLFAGISRGARAIHFELYENGLSVRYRIDGMLQALPADASASLTRGTWQQVVSKIKALCDMDGVDRHRPKSGAFSIKTISGDEVRRIHLRVSTIPSSYGESVVIRIFEPDTPVPSIDHLGLAPEQTRAIHEVLHKPGGIFLVTGPADSGRSRTLHALLSAVTAPAKKTLTIEDPIEYAVPNAVQTEVNEVAGNTFAALLNAAASQDADNVLVGDVTDAETARMAFQAALSGRSVFCAFHGGDATEIIPRLMDFGIEAGVLASTLRLVISQRLLPRICPKCLAVSAPPPHILKAFGWTDIPALNLKKGSGCASCNHTGYSGRSPVSEVWVPTREELALLDRRPNNILLRGRLFTPGKRPTLLEDGLRRVAAGETTLEELYRMVPSDHLEPERGRLRPMPA